MVPRGGQRHRNLPDTGSGLIVANHAGTLPFDGPMLSVAVHDHHPRRRDVRLLVADLAFDMPVLGPIARKAGYTMACNTDANRLLAGENWPQFFPRATRGWANTSGTATNCSDSAVGVCGRRVAQQGADHPVLDRRLRRDLSDDGRRQAAGSGPGRALLPDHPVVPLAGPLGLVPLPSKWHIAFGAPIDTAHFDEGAADDPMVTFELTDQVRETIQQTLFQLLSQRGNAFLG